MEANTIERNSCRPTHRAGEGASPALRLGTCKAVKVVAKRRCGEHRHSAAMRVAVRLRGSAAVALDGRSQCRPSTERQGAIRVPTSTTPGAKRLALEGEGKQKLSTEANVTLWTIKAREVA